MVKNEVLASTRILSFLVRERIEIAGLGTGLGVAWVEGGFIRLQIQ